MKLVAIPTCCAALCLMVFPAVFATGEAGPLGCTGIAQLDTTLATIRTIESGSDYTATNRGSTASGAYQFLDSTWANYAGFPHAWQAPPTAQDAKAIEHVQSILETHNGDVSAVPVVWYIGYVPTASSVDWDTIPYPSAGNVLTPRQYQTRWLAEYATQTDGSAATSSPCAPGGSVTPNADGYAIPGPADLFARADTSAPHAGYPAWDWLIPVGTPIYAIRGGTVITVQYWPHNWWDLGCGNNPTGCRTCGIGITILDLDGNHWAYCHGDAAHVQVGQEIPAGTQILTSGNTGRSGTPHLHIEFSTPDGIQRCLQSFLSDLRIGRVTVQLDALPINGCLY